MKFLFSIAIIFLICFCKPCYSQLGDSLLTNYLAEFEPVILNEISSFLKPNKYIDGEATVPSFLQKIQIKFVSKSNIPEHSIYFGKINKDSIIITKSYFNSGYVKEIILAKPITDEKFVISFYEKPKGKKKIVYTTKNSKFDGKAIYYTKNGKIHQELFFVKGVLNECKQYALTDDNIVYTYMPNTDKTKYIKCETFIDGKLANVLDMEGKAHLFPSIIYHLPLIYFDEKVSFEIKKSKI